VSHYCSKTQHFLLAQHWETGTKKRFGTANLRAARKYPNTSKSSALYRVSCTRSIERSQWRCDCYLQPEEK